MGIKNAGSESVHTTTAAWEECEHRRVADSILANRHAQGCHVRVNTGNGPWC